MACNLKLFLYCVFFVYSVSSVGHGIHTRSDDVNTADLRKVIQQQSAVIQNLQAKVTAMDNAMNQQSSLVQTIQTELAAVKSKLTKHVAFSADYIMPSLTSLNFGSGGVLKFSNVISNSGGGYSASTGAFTAPVAGNYAFYLSIRSDNTHGYLVVGLEKNGHQMGCYAVAQGKGEVIYDKGVCFVVSHLNAGDEVLARQNGGGTYLENWHFTTFSGFLLYAD